jgi:hypothetical protein
MAIGSGKIPANGDSSSTTDISSSWRYRLRADLQFVQETAADSADTNVALLDPRSGERHLITADEFAICRLAGGGKTLAEIRHAYKIETGREFALGRLFSFFRQLRSKGLLDEAGEAKSPPDRSGGDQASAPAPMPDHAPPDTAPPAAPASAAPSLEANQAIAKRKERRASRSLTKGRRWTKSGQGPAGAAVNPAVKTDGQNAEGPHPSGADAEKPVEATTAGQIFDDLDGPETVAGNWPPSEAGGDAETSGAPLKAREEPRQGARMGRARAASTGAEEGSAEPSGLGGHDDFLGAGGFGAGKGGGVFRQMLSAGLEGRGRAGGQNLFAGLAARARGEQEKARIDHANAPRENRVFLFNPDVIFGVLANLTWPLKYGFYPLVLAVPAATWITYANRHLLLEDIKAFDVAVVAPIIVGLFIANLVCRFTQAILLRSFGGKVRQFGIGIVFGVAPRFFVDLSEIGGLSRRGQLWVHAAPLIARLGLFVVGTLLWLAVRESVPWLSHEALIVAQIGLFAFVLSALPLLASDGYRWLATYFGKATLYEDAFRRSPGAIAVPNETMESEVESSGPVFFVLAIAIVGAALGLLVQSYVDVATTGDVHWLTRTLLLGFLVSAAGWSVALYRSKGDLGTTGLDPAATLKLLASVGRRGDLAIERSNSIITIGKVFWALVLCLLLALTAMKHPQLLKFCRPSAPR